MTKYYSFYFFAEDDFQNIQAIVPDLFQGINPRILDVRWSRAANTPWIGKNVQMFLWFIKWFILPAKRSADFETSRLFKCPAWFQIWMDSPSHKIISNSLDIEDSWQISQRNRISSSVNFISEKAILWKYTKLRITVMILNVEHYQVLEQNEGSKSMKMNSMKKHWKKTLKRK